MCTVALALGIASTVIGGAGQIQQAQASAAASKYNADVADMNAQLNERRAKDALDRGRLAEQQKLEQVAQAEGRQKAAFAANGVDIGFGSPLDIIVDTATLGELDALTIRRNAANEAYDFRVQAATGQAQAGLDRANADSALTGGYLGAFGTILAGSADAWKQYRTPLAAIGGK